MIEQSAGRVFLRLIESMNMQIKNKSKDEPFVIDAVIRFEDEKVWSIDHFRDLYPGAEITSIDGKDVLGKCVSCDAYLLDGDQTFDWTDEIGCAECEEKRLKGEK